MATTFLIVDGDWVLDQSIGRPMTVKGPAKVRQEFGELLSIETHPSGFGASLINLVGEVPENPLDVSFQVTSRVTDAVNRWISLQRKQRSILTAEEVVSRLSFNQAKVDETTKTDVRFRSSIMTKAGDEITRGGVISTTGTG